MHIDQLRDKLSRQTLDESLQKTNRELRYTHNELTKLRKQHEIAQRHNKLDQLKRELEHAHACEETQRGILLNSENEKNTINKECQLLQEEENHLRAELKNLETYQEGELEKIKETVDQMRSNYKELKKDYSRLQKKHQELSRKTTDVDQEIANLKEDISSMESLETMEEVHLFCSQILPFRSVPRLKH